MQADEPPFIKNKFAQLVVGVMCTDYPHAWPQVWAQLLGLLPGGPVAIDLFLRVQHGQSAPLAVPHLAPAPPQGAPGGPVQLGTPRVSPSHWAPSHRLRCSS